MSSSKNEINQWQSLNFYSLNSQTKPVVCPIGPDKILVMGGQRKQRNDEGYFISPTLLTPVNALVFKLDKKRSLRIIKEIKHDDTQFDAYGQAYKTRDGKVLALVVNHGRIDFSGIGPSTQIVSFELKDDQGMKAGGVIRVEESFITPARELYYQLSEVQVEKLRQAESATKVQGDFASGSIIKQSFYKPGYGDEDSQRSSD